MHANIQAYGGGETRILTKLDSVCVCRRIQPFIEPHLPSMLGSGILTSMKSLCLKVHSQTTTRGDECDRAGADGVNSVCLLTVLLDPNQLPLCLHSGFSLPGV